MSGRGGRGRSDAHALWQGLQQEHARYVRGVRDLPTELLSLQQDMRRYLCLRFAGFLEQLVFVVICEYLEQKSSGPVNAFARSWFRQAPNLKTKQFINLIGRFGEDHQADFESFLNPTRREALNDLLEVRNNVAHGLSSSGQKLDPSRYLQLCDDIYGWLVAQFLGESVEVLDDSGGVVVGHERTPS